MDYSLSLTFVTESGDKANITIADVRSDLTNEEVYELVTVILQENIFLSKNGSFVSFYSASLTEKNKKTFDIKIWQNIRAQHFFAEPFCNILNPLSLII